MIKQAYQKHNNANAQSKNSNIIQDFRKNDREFLRQKINNIYYRMVVISLRQIDSQSSDKNADKNRSPTQQEIKINQEYDLQCSIDSNFVVKNLFKTLNKDKMIWVQQDYDCFLSDFSLENLDFQKRIRIFFCIAHGVRDLHQKLIFHGSLSPNTIAIKINQQQIIAKINCFQTAAVLQHQKSTSQEILYCKTFAYLATNDFTAPQVLNNRNYGLKADIWSLGCLLNYMLYDTLENIWQNEQQTQVEVPAGTPDWLLQMLRSMLHNNPAKRYEIQTIFDLIASSQKCIETLNKYILVGKKSLRLQKIPSKLNFEKRI